MDSSSDGFGAAALTQSNEFCLGQVFVLTGFLGRRAMKVRNSLKSLKNRHRDCRVIRRKGRILVINKTQRRFKARQG